MSWFRLHTQLRNPFPHGEFKSLWHYASEPRKHKVFEMQLMKYAYNCFELDINIIFSGEDHAGPSFELNLFGLTLSVKLYDTRHWNYDTGDWMKYHDNPNSEASN